MADFWLLPALLLAGWFWLDSMRTHEHAIKVARRACDRHDVQLLDQTVALSKLRLGRSANGLRWRRIYRFEFSQEGDNRSSGEIELLGMRVTGLRLVLGDGVLHEVGEE